MYPKYRVAVISHPCVIDENQKIYNELARFDDIEVCLFFPKKWYETHRWKIGYNLLKEPHFIPYPSTVISLSKKYNLHLHFYPVAWAKVWRIKPHLILIEEEPYSLPAFQFALIGYLRGSKIIFWTKQNILKFFKPPFSYFENFCMKVSASAIALTEAVKSVLEEKKYNKKIYIVPHGIDEMTFKPSNEKPQRDGVIIGYVGRIWKDKGIFDFIEAVRLLREEFKNFKVFIAGSGEDVESLKKEIRALQGTVEYIGAVPHSEIYKIYQKLHILVLPSRTTSSWKEQLGRVLVECAMCGVYPVGSSSGEIPNIVGNLGGEVFREGDPMEMKEKIKNIIENKKYLTQSERLRENAIKHYSLKSVAESLFRAIKEVIEETKNGD